MINRILEIVVLLIDYFRDNQDHFLNIDDFSTSLKAKGYTDSEITSAYSWLLERYENSPEKYFSEFPEMPIANRVLTDLERQQLSTSAQGFLFKLLSLSLIDNEQFETIVERANMVSNFPVELDQIKLLASSVLFRDIDDIDAISIFDPEFGSSNLIN